ncbi:MAG: acetate kinase [Lachnospiraceae bacterium]|nr:acetate kinase [Lachnospiraceae bacterium]
MKVLVINCGSSSLKYQLIDTETEDVLAKGLCERIGIDGRLTHTKSGSDKVTKDVPMPDHDKAVSIVLDTLTDAALGVVSSLNEIDAVGHRVVHGGERFAKSVIVDDEVFKAIEEVSDLAPLHNPANLTGIRACMKLMPGVPQTAVFDTAFHQTMPDYAYIYGIPYEYYEKYKIRRYGFHGTSHSFVSKRAIELLGKPAEDTKVIVCHLGNGSSITAVEGGKSVDTSMGLTPLAGVSMGTRSGLIDPAIIEFIADKEGASLKEVMSVMNKKSGMLGLSGVSSDFRDLDKGISEGNERCRLAVELFAYQTAKYVGAYVAAMNGVDAICFTAGVGENNSMVRKQVVDRLGFLGITLDEEANKIRGEEQLISTPDSKVKVFVIPTNEELAIARETVELL